MLIAHNSLEFLITSVDNLVISFKFTTADEIKHTSREHTLCIHLQVFQTDQKYCYFM